MPTVNYDLKITAPGDLTRGRTLSDSERSRLFGRAEISDRKPSSGVVSRRLEQTPSPTEEPERETPEERLAFIKEGNEALIQEVEAQMDRLEAQSASLVYEFDRRKEPELARAVDALFGGNRSKIDFKMYRAALDMKIELSLKLGRELSREFA